MRLRHHIQPTSVRVVLFHLAGAGGLLGVLLLVPLFASLVLGEWNYVALFGIMAAGTVLAGFSWRYFFEPGGELKVTDALVVTALVYLLFALLGAVPFLSLGSFSDALFESMSGFTTTGLSVFNEADLPLSLHFFRAYAQWIGGMGIIVLSLAVLLRSGKTASKLYWTEFGEENIVGSVVSTAKVVIRIYLILTVLGYGAYLLAGMGPFDALIHILTTIPTGGFSLYGDSIGHYGSPLISLVVSLFMILGSISFPLYYLAFKNGPRDFFSDHQMRYLVLIVLLAAIVFAFSFGGEISSVTEGIFQATTAITTTGYNTVPTAPLPDRDKVLTTLLMLIGGSTGSTAGGLKILRLLMLIGFMRVMFFRSVLPKEAKIPISFGGEVVTREEAESVAAFFVTYLAIMAISTLALMWIEGFGFLDTLFEVASAEGTVGMSVGITSSTLSAPSKLILTLNMWLGRLEIIPVLVALFPHSWKRL